ncbi:dipicolinate synthase subunit DpsA [Sulfoacidibacillus thermotolerans]|uniref:Dipicolinic acid synthetase subunit A n=1 Tax=Sulfoacidibacillus thermotolerans TaxID=1765684 RepID=A0A2U3DAI9_SULT2|nr:dipicolinate synthase subunit DpsA [Sulfoacidibacillus thermotolerans]PWI58275.1 dipicolinic acid synthetase subunit A [Sulfoacidibacillus thermotolerans]
MLTGIKMAFIGGDARIIEVVRYMSDLDASTYLFGFDRLSLSFPDMHKVELSPAALADFDVIVLPIAGMDDEGRVDAAFSDAPLRLSDEHFAAISKKAPVFSGIARPALQTLAHKHGLNLIRLMELDEVAILNSIPTAEGAIAMAMERTEITLHGSTCAVLGLGRCGLTLARMLSGIGANVRVFARKPAELARIYEMGLRPYGLSQLVDAIADADVIFNTIPAPILTADVLAHVPRSCVIIDIASIPGGTDFRYAEKRGINAVLAPSLPGIVAPKTAGRIIAQTIVQMIQTPLNAPGGM